MKKHLFLALLTGYSAIQADPLKTINLSPNVQFEKLEQLPGTSQTELPNLASGVLKSFLSAPLILGQNTIRHAPVITGAEGNRLLPVIGTKVYVNQLNADAPKSWLIYRIGKPLTDPGSQKSLGIESTFLGKAEVVFSGKPAVIQITELAQEVTAGDILIAPMENNLNTLTPRRPAQTIDGSIISIHGRNSMEAAMHSIIAINRGAQDGLRQGDILSIYRADTVTREIKQSLSNTDNARESSSLIQLQADHKSTVASVPVPLPQILIGSSIVFQVADHLSYALITQSTHPIRIADVVTSR